MGQLMKCDGGGNELPKDREIRNTKLGFPRISVFKL
jgi:hypothetical protein